MSGTWNIKTDIYLVHFVLILSLIKVITSQIVRTSGMFTQIS